MCLAIGSETRPERKGLSRVWWRLAESPVRLFSAGAVFHSVIIAAVLMHTFLANGEIERLTATAMTTGVASLFAFGPLMQRFPQWAERYPIHYMAYSSTFMTAFIGLLFIEIHPLSAKNLLPVGIAFLGVSLVIGLRSLWSVYGWVRPYRKRQARLAITALAFTALLLSGLLLNSFRIT